MPTYEFQCIGCGKLHEEFYRLDDCPEQIACHKCGDSAVKVISLSSVFPVTPSWLADAHTALCDEGEPPIETRSQHDQMCKDRGARPKS